MPRLLFTPGKDLAPIVQEAGWGLGPVWTGAENLDPPPRFGPRTVQPVASQRIYVRENFLCVHLIASTIMSVF